MLGELFVRRCSVLLGLGSELDPQRSISHTETMLQRQELCFRNGNSKQISSCDHKIVFK